MYSISWAYGHDYREVAKWNNISPPYIVKRGQRLRVSEPVTQSINSGKYFKNKKIGLSSGVKGTNKESETIADNQTVAKVVTGGISPVKDKPKTLVWKWPTRGGKIIQVFDPNDPGKQGVDVAGNMGQPIYSAEAGRVVYSGGGLTRYGKLIIVKHNETFLSAYAHNKRLLVKEGDVLKAGQLIAEMGSTGANTTKLHFEIRRNGKPVNPLNFLPKRQ